MSERLYIYTNDCDYACAFDQHDALNQWCKTIGEDASGYDAADWSRLSDAKELSFWCEPDGKIGERGAPNALVKKTCREWVYQCGRGYLGSTEC